MKSAAERRAEEFLLGKERNIKNKNNYYSRKLLKKTSKNLIFKSNTYVKNIVSAANKKPEVMVKIANRKSTKTSGVKAVANHIDYISRNGKLILETNDGLKLNGPEVKQIAKSWQMAGMIHENTKKQALNVILSMPKDTDPEKVHAGAKAFAKEVFKDHEYVFALHTDEDHPHVHICVTMQNSHGQRMNPRKNDLYQWRMFFAEKMREQGVECAATKRYHRMQINKGNSSIVRNINKRGGYSYVNYMRLKKMKEDIKTGHRPINQYLHKHLENQKLAIKEYKTLSRLLYQEGLKTEARAVSKFANELENKKLITKEQEYFDKVIRNRALEI